MNYQRISVMFLICASFVLASSASYAGEFNRQLMPRPNFKNQTPAVPDPNSPRLKAAREQGLAEAKGLAKPLVKNAESWTPLYNLYVGCTNKPLDESYSTIQDAVAVALPYTVISVCPGRYYAGGADTGIDVYTSFVKIKGVSSYAGAQTLACDDGPTPNDNSWGFYLAGDYDSVVNMTIDDCTYGVYIGSASESFVVNNDEVWYSSFNDDFDGVVAYFCDECKVQDSKFQNNYYPIYTEADTKDFIIGNSVQGDGTGADDGIFVEYGVSAKIESNSVSASDAGLDFEEYNNLAWVESNHFDGNEYGVYISAYDNGNTFESNYANGNLYAGFDTVDATDGADAGPDASPNQFLKNHAFGNGIDDYFDDTYGYTGPNTHTNDDTADYYKGNKGNYADPASIL